MVVRRAARFRVDRYSSFVVNLLEAPFDKPFGRLMVQSTVEGLTALSNVEGLRPPLLRVMQNTGHRTISPLKRDPQGTYLLSPNTFERY